MSSVRSVTYVSGRSFLAFLSAIVDLICWLLPQSGVMPLRLISFLLYVISCFSPVLVLGEEGRVVSGFAALATGWAFLLAGVFCWLANPLWMLAWVISWGAENRASGMVFSGSALLLGLSVFLLPGQDPGRGTLVSLPVTGLDVGAYCWLAALVTQVVACWLCAQPEGVWRKADGEVEVPGE
jgi:hypothetical protein